MTFANKTSKFAKKLQTKHLILQLFTTKTVLFCKIGKSLAKEERLLKHSKGFIGFCYFFSGH